MKGHKKIVLGIVVTVVIVVLVSVLISFFLDQPLSRILWLRLIQQSQQRRLLILCETDHKALLEAGREILSQVPKDSLNPQPDGSIYLGSFPVPKEIHIPKIIENLKPHVVVIDYYGYITLGMHGGMDHFGVKIYPADFKEPSRNFKYGGRELLPGLWYYDDGYLHNPEYDKRINKLIEEHKDKSTK
jgi:hypothetical protein